MSPSTITSLAGDLVPPIPGTHTPAFTPASPGRFPHRYTPYGKPATGPVGGATWIGLQLSLATAYHRGGQFQDAATVLLHVLPFVPLLAVQGGELPADVVGAAGRLPTSPRARVRSLRGGGQHSPPAITHICVMPGNIRVAGHRQAPLLRSGIVTVAAAGQSHVTLHVVPLALQAALLWVRNLVCLDQCPAAAASCAFLLHILERFTHWRALPGALGRRDPAPTLNTGAAAVARAKAVAQVHMERGRALSRWVQHPAAAEGGGQGEGSGRPLFPFVELPRLCGNAMDVFRTWSDLFRYGGTASTDLGASTPARRRSSVVAVTVEEEAALPPLFVGDRFVGMWDVMQAAVASFHTAAVVWGSVGEAPKAMTARVGAAGVVLEWRVGKEGALPEPFQGVPVSAAQVAQEAQEAGRSDTPSAGEDAQPATGPLTDTVAVHRALHVALAWGVQSGSVVDGESRGDGGRALGIVLREWQAGPSLPQAMWHAQAGLEAAGQWGDVLLAIKCHLYLAEGFVALRWGAPETEAEVALEHFARALTHWVEAQSVFRSMLVVGGSVPLARRRDTLWQGALTSLLSRMLQCLCLLGQATVNRHVGLLDLFNAATRDIARSASSTALSPPCRNRLADSCRHRGGRHCCSGCHGGHLRSSPLLHSLPSTPPPRPLHPMAGCSASGQSPSPSGTPCRPEGRAGQGGGGKGRRLCGTER